MTLIAVLSCWSNVAAADAIRKTWSVSSPIPVRFFLGQPKKGFPRAARPDETFLDCPDDYMSLPRKTQLAIHYARVNGFTSIIKLDDDVYCRPERLNVNAWDYVGQLMPPKTGYPKGFMHGGAGYCLSQRAMDIVINTPIPTGEKSEDGHVANALAAHGIIGRDDPRFQYTRRVFGDSLPQVPAPDNGLIAGGELHTLAGGRSELFQVHRKFTTGE